MKTMGFKLAVAAVVALAACGVSHAQTVIVNHLDEATAAKVRASVDASLRAAATGKRIGMISGKVDPQAVTAADGTVSLELDASTMMFSVARRGADGRIEMVCTSGVESAHKAVNAPAFAKRYTLAVKE